MTSTTHRPRALVTGAAGFIGSHLTEALLADGWQVTGIDAFTENYAVGRKQANVSAALDHPAFQLVACDLLDADLRGLAGDADVVFHLAAEPGVTGSWGRAFDRYSRRNVTATQRLLEAVAGTTVHRFVYASSSSVYGDAGSGPASPYGVTKLAAEHLVGAYSRERGVPGVSLRFFTVYGPRQRPDMAFARFIDAALLDAPLTVYGDGQQVRDVTFVTDVVAATTAAAAADLPPGTVLDVGGGSPVSVRSAISALGHLVGRTLAVTHEPGRPGEVRRTHAATGVTRATLGWAPLVDIREGLGRQLRWRARELGVPIGTRSGRVFSVSR